jgi:hypothetical protein
MRTLLLRQRGAELAHRDAYGARISTDELGESARLAIEPMRTSILYWPSSPSFVVKDREKRCAALTSGRLQLFRQ